MPLSQIGDELDRSNAWQKAVGSGSCRNETGKSRDLDRSCAIALGNYKNAFRRILRPDHRIPRLWIEPYRSRKFAVIDPVAQHELVLVLDARVDEIAEQPALDSIIWPGGIVGRSVWQTTADQAVSIVAPAGLTLAGNGLAARIDPAHMRAHGAAQAPGIARAIGIDILEVMSRSGGNPPAGLSLSGDKASGTPLRQRPHILAASSSGSILSLFD